MASTPTLSFSGLASGIDTTSIIAQLTAVAQKPVTNLQNQKAAYNTTLATWQGVNTQLSALQTAANALNQPSTYSTASASSSNTAAATLTTLPGAALGSHALTVTQLAQAQKVVSSSVPSGSTALGRSGSFTLNGKTIQVNGSDALADISVKINASQAGVSATVVNVGPNDFRLTLTSSQTGALHTIAASDNTTPSSPDGILAGLGILGAGPAAIRQSVSGTQGGASYVGAASLALNSPTQAVGGLLGIPAGAVPAGTFQISNGGTGPGSSATVSLNLDTDSLSDVANAINKAGVAGVSAEVVTVPDANGNLGRIHQLQIRSGSGTAPAFTDPNGLLSTIGVLQSPYKQTITQAKDAQFNMDGLDLTRSTNSISDVIPGVTISLQSGTAAAPATTTLNVTQNTDSIVQAVNAFASAYNAIQDFATAQNKFTPPAGAAAGAAGSSPPLFGNSTLSQIQSQLAQTLTAVSGTVTLQSIGITLGGSGDLSVDNNALTQALQADPKAVSNLFSLSGRSDNSDIQFVGGGPKSAASGGAGYGVNVTQPATQATGQAGTAGTGGVSAAPETLSFGGALFPAGVHLTLPVGSTLQDTVNLINGTSSLNTQIYATIDKTNHLVLASQGYGAKTGFSVSSDSAGDGTNSGIGSALAVTAGVSVAGTINGEPATGNGRTLTGNAGNAHTEGIRLLVSATSASPAGGVSGHVALTHGVADSLSTILSQILDPINGSVAGAENSLNTQISDAQAQITEIQSSVSTYQAYLTQEFSAMETRISALQAQGNAFAAQIGAATANSSAGASKTSAG